MNITSLEISDKTSLLNYLRHNTVLFKNPDIQPYLDAEISIREIRQSSIWPHQTYIYKTQLDFMAEFDRYLQENHGIDFLKQTGFMTYTIDGVTYAMYPPIVEYVDGKLLLIDGTHRASYAARRNENQVFTAAIIKGVSKNIKPSVLPSPAGWPGVKEYATPADRPEGIAAKFKRYATKEEYQYYFRVPNFPGISKLLRSESSIDLGEISSRNNSSSNLRNERELKWALPKFVLPRTHSYLIKFIQIAQGYIKTGNNLSLSGGVLSASGRPALRLSDDNLASVQRGVLDFEGNFPDDSEFRYRKWDKDLLATFKGGTSNGGRDRPQVELGIEKRDYNLLRGLAADEIQKSRCIIPDGMGKIEIDFYDRPDLSFVSIEREFVDGENPNGYCLPNWLARLHPIDVTDERAFKNKNITKRLADGQFAADARFQELWRAKTEKTA